MLEEDGYEMNKIVLLSYEKGDFIRIKWVILNIDSNKRSDTQRYYFCTSWITLFSFRRLALRM